jgi:uronate dehydrogenase
MSTVLVTGAAGLIGTFLRNSLPDLGWQLRCTDVKAADGVEVADVASEQALDEVVPGVDAIVHLAAQPVEAPWPVIRDANLDGCYQLFEAARRHGVRRVVYASSNHAVGFTPNEDELPATTPPRPDTLYGVSKVFGEALGRYYAERYGMRVACLRIGTCAEKPPNMRALSTWLSPGDCGRLVDACLRSDRLDYAIVWGVSANTRRTWSLSEGNRLGYVPKDDAEQFADSLADATPSPSDRFVGGEFTTERYGIDEVTARW